MSTTPHRLPCHPKGASPWGRWLVAIGLCLIGSVSLAGCPGEIEDPDRFLTGAGTGGGAGNCPDIPDLLMTSCGIANCHDSMTAAGMLDLGSPDIASRVVGVAATAACNGDPLADPSDPTGSVLHNVLTDSSCSPLGRMPLAASPFSQQEIDCVEQWIGGLMGGGATTTTTTTGGGMGGAGMGGAGGGTGGTGGT